MAIAVIDAPYSRDQTNSPIALEHAREKRRLLVVEDSFSEQMRLKAMLTKLDYEVLLATDGQEALAVLDDTPVQLIISDWRMPNLSGIDLCRRIRQTPHYGDPYFILLTGCDTPLDLVAGMDAGADDFIAKPFNSEELRVRLQAGLRVIGLRNELKQRNSALAQTLQKEAEANHRIQQDLNTAAVMQQALLPDGDSPFSQLELATLFKPASVVAGDTYNYFKLDDRHLGFYHLDVAGHGIASAMLSFTLSRLLSPDTLQHELHLPDTAVTPCRPHEVVAALNQRFLHEEFNEHYFTMLYGVLDVTTGKGEFCQAGHPHPLLCRADGTVQRLGGGGFPVAMLTGADYESTPFTLRRGDRLWLYSDGITDCRSEHGKSLGMEQFATLIKQTTQSELRRLPVAVDKILTHWHGAKTLDDDISLLVIGYNAKTKASLHAKPVRLIIPASENGVANATVKAGKYCRQHNLPEAFSFQVEVAVAEVLNNVLEHALPNRANHKIELICHLQDDALVIKAIDDGLPLQTLPGDKRMPACRAESGRGWPIIINWIDEISFNRANDRNHLLMKKRIPLSA
jgi:sigma-B regulation protein RsbU (phosphoserine phosphatase)